MRRLRTRAVLAAALLLAGPAARAEPRQQDRRSDTAAMSPALQAMQADDAANPGMLGVLDGEAAWNAPAGTMGKDATGKDMTGKACAGCHGEAPASMRGVAARYPAWDEADGRPLDLAGRIERCRVRHQGASALAPEAPERLALEAYVAFQSRGQPIAPPVDPGMASARERGRGVFTRRMGQLDLACATCHDDHAGGRLAGAPIPQGHPVGYPIYRLEWQGLGSLRRRLRNCMTGIRAAPLPDEAPELVDLEAFLMQRAAGLPVETPAVRP